MQTKDHTNRSIHWTHQSAVLDKMVDPVVDHSKPQKTVKDLQLIELLPGETFRRTLFGDGQF